MTKGWRPEGWKNPFVGRPRNMVMTTDYSISRDIFEAGADAMLEALRGMGERVDNTGAYPKPKATVIQNGVITEEPLMLVASLKKGEHGVMVFIPDEKAEG